MEFRRSVVAALAAMPSAAPADRFYVPLGYANSILVADRSAERAIGRIDEAPAGHGLTPTPDGRYLVAGSADESPAHAGAPDKSEAVPDAEHAVYHPVAGGGDARPSVTVSGVSIIDTAAAAVVRRVDLTGEVHHAHGRSWRPWTS